MFFCILEHFIMYTVRASTALIQRHIDYKFQSADISNKLAIIHENRVFIGIVAQLVLELE